MKLVDSILMKQLNRTLLVGTFITSCAIGIGFSENIAVASSINTVEGGVQILPHGYQHYATKMNIVVKNYDAGFTFTLPWRVVDGVYFNMPVKTDSEHIQGYSFNLATASAGEGYTVSFTKRNNRPALGTSQKVWNTTWYDVPIKGMSSAKYLDIWRKHSNVFERNVVEGGFFEKREAQAARWSRITPKKDSDEVVGSLMEVEFIMKQDSTHRYNMASTYPSSAQTFMERGILETIIPSFSLINSSNYEKMGSILVDDGVSFVKPDGFSRVKSNGKIVFTKGDIQLNVESISIPWKAISTGVPTLMGKQTLGDQYVAALVKVNDARIDRYEMRIINNRVAFLVAGEMNDISEVDTMATVDVELVKSLIKRKGDRKRISFVSEIVLGNQGKVGIARMIGPEGTDLMRPELIDIIDGLRIDDIIGADSASTVL